MPCACLSVCLSVCMYSYVYMYVCIYVCMCVSICACMCVRASVCMYIGMSITYYLTSNLLHLESNINVGLLAYMRTDACRHLKLDVRHKNSHVCIHTHTYSTDRHTLQARTYMYARMYPHADTRLYPYTYTQMYACPCIHTMQTQIRHCILWRLIRDSTGCFLQ